MEDGRNNNDFSQGKVSKRILQMALPMTVAQLVNVLYNIVDRLFLARIPDTGMLALTGAGLVFPVIVILNAFANLCGTGGAPLCSIARGEGDYARAERLMGNAFFLLLVFAGTLIAVAYPLRKEILYLAGASADSFPYAEKYIRIYLFGMPFVMISLGMNAFINAQGFGRMGMRTVMLGAAVNLVLDPLFIFGFGWGVEGAALATVIAQASSAVWVLFFLTGKRAILKLRLKNLRPSGKILGRIVTLGFAGFTMTVTTGAVGFLCNGTLQRLGGDAYVSVMTIINSIREMVMMPASGLSDGAKPVMGYNYGAKRYDRLRACMRFCTALMFSYMVVAWVVLQSVPGLLVSIFNTDPAFLTVAIPCVRLYFAAFFFMAGQSVGQSVFVALGRAKHAIFFSIFRKGILVIPLVLLLPEIPALGVMGVFLAEPIADIGGGVVCYTAMRRVLRKQVPAAEPQEAQPPAMV